MLSTSPYDIIQADPPKWQPQEDRAASAFIGITFFLCLETLFEIFRIFKKRRGLYFWSLFLGVTSCFVDAIAITLKYLVHGSTSYWPLYTLFGLSGWTCFSLCQLIVLYSRLHLLVDDPRLQRWVLYLICACALFFNLPTWIVVWPAYNTDPEITKRWSPPDAIVERFTQIGFTLAECVVSGVYFHALRRLLTYKPTVRQRRVFLDLVYVNVATILFDVLTTVLVYLNQLGISHPVQVLSYILKFRLEFAVLNQLMAVAARGIHRETFGEKRYHDASLGASSYYGQQYPMSDIIKDPGCLVQSNSGDGSENPYGSESSKGETDIAVPAPVFEEAITKSRSRHHSGDDVSLPLQGRRTSTRRNRRHLGTGDKARSLVRSLRPGSHHGGGTHDSTEDDDEDEIPLHMWERNGEIVMRIPWLAQSHRHEV
ncbi:MAG: hypothetical protein L6R41_004349 [Letrouitia leprolyta]|nr:MAG: hypothetical protein L6R41_004349 [Letrouitia leprolyta]